MSKKKLIKEIAGEIVYELTKDIQYKVNDLESAIKKLEKLLKSDELKASEILYQLIKRGENENKQNS